MKDKIVIFTIIVLSFSCTDKQEQIDVENIVPEIESQQPKDVSVKYFNSDLELLYEESFLIGSTIIIENYTDSDTNGDFIYWNDQLDLTGNVLYPNQKQYISQDLELFAVLSGENINVEDNDLYLYFENNKCGYFNLDREIIIEAQYVNGTKFIDGYAIVKLSETYSDGVNTGHFAVIDKNGSPKFDFFHEGYNTPQISDGRILIEQNGISGYLNLNGELVLNGYPFASRFSNGLASVSDSLRSDSYIIDINGNPQKRNGTLIQFRHIGIFHNGLAHVIGEDRLQGFIDTHGTVVIPIEYTYLDQQFFNGLCVAAKDSRFQNTTEKGVFGYINMKNEWIIEPHYFEAKPFYNDFAAVRYRENKSAFENGSWKLIDIDDEVIKIFDPKIVIYGGMNNGRYMYSVENDNSGVVGILRENGEFLTDMVLRPYFHSSTGQYNSVLLNNKNAIITDSGDIILNEVFFSY